MTPGMLLLLQQPLLLLLLLLVLSLLFWLLFPSVKMSPFRCSLQRPCYVSLHLVSVRVTPANPFATERTQEGSKKWSSSLPFST